MWSVTPHAIRRCKELLKKIEDNNRGRPAKNIPDGTVRNITRTSAAQDAGLSERQRKTALQVATIPEDEFEEAIESDDPPTLTELAERGTIKKSPSAVLLRAPREVDMVSSAMLLALLCHLKNIPTRMAMICAIVTTLSQRRAG